MLLSKYKKKIYSLYNRKKKNGGRNNRGRITVAHQGGGHKQLYRTINFQETFEKGIVINTEYDPNRSANIAKLYSIDAKKNIRFNYIIAPRNLKILDIITSADNATFISNNEENTEKQVGSFYYLKDFAVGDFIYNIELSPNIGGQLVRSAGAFAQVIQKTENFVTISLPSGEHRMVPDTCKACFGFVSNENHANVVIKKAGRSRWLNIRPTVRGVAMNPIDHPHGGNTSGGIHPKTPWARLTKGRPTRSLKKKNKLIIKSAKKRNIN